jgi:magnesium-protoporphyrin IX monomethyl ester (oxidative) cyclase
MTMEPVVLVCAPFFSVVRPALGVSLLKAALEERSIDSRVEYLNLRFADRIGVDFHESAATGVANTLLVGEWIFSPMVNGTRKPALEESYLATLRTLYSDHHLAALESIRNAARSFIDEEANRLLEGDPAIIGFSTSFQQNCASIALAMAVKELRPEVTICFGGANCEGPMGQALLDSYPAIDFVFSGEADHTFPRLVGEVLRGAKPARTTITSGGLVNELDALPPPDFADYFETLDAGTFRERIRPALVYESSRGCWWGAKKHCRFCGLNGNQMVYRAKSARRVIDELDGLAGRYDVSQFLAADNIMDMKHVTTVFGALGEKSRDYRFFCEVKANLTRAQLEQISSGGVTWIQPGIESLDDALLREMEKGVTALQNICLLRNCTELGMRAIWTILYGFPGESPEQYERVKNLVPLIEHLDPPGGCVPIRLDRFSPYYERASDFGFEDVRPVPAYGGIYALDPDVLSRLAYFFEGSSSRGDARGFTGDLEGAVDDWNRKFFSPRAEPPLLVATRDLVGTLVEDTRSAAVQRWRYLDDEETAMLDSFREPRKRIERNAAFDALVDLRYILIDGDRALSLVVESGPRMSGGETASQFPGGYLLPPM